MITLDNINEHGIEYIIMAINDLVSLSGKVDSQSGMTIGYTWLTPEECYWLYQLIVTRRESCLVDETVLSKLRNGTNHPESLK